MTRPRDRRQKWRRQGLDGGPEESMMTMEATAEENEHEDYNNDNGGVRGGYMTCQRDQRRRQSQ